MSKAIQIEGVCKTFGSGRKVSPVLSDLTLDVDQGEVFGFIGPNGAGKSTTIKLLLHFLRPDRGILRVMGRMVGNEEFRNQLGYLPESPCFYDHLTASETMGFAGRLSGISGAKLSESIPVLLKQVDLADGANKSVGTYSKGMKQRLGLAVALVHDPDIFILDEPMSGLDPIGRHLVKNVIDQLRTQGKTVFFSSHILGDVDDLCDRIGILHRGHLLYQGSVHEFRRSGRLEESFIKLIEEWDSASAG
ncbi:MAG: ABC transporter ATP-binding protein [Dissulfuribacterales bacterium]